MWYIACLAIGALIVTLLYRYQIQQRRKQERLERELAEQKAKNVSKKMADLPLSDLVKRANQRWGAKFEKAKGPRRSDH